MNNIKIDDEMYIQKNIATLFIMKRDTYTKPINFIQISYDQFDKIAHIIGTKKVLNHTICARCGRIPENRDWITAYKNSDKFNLLLCPKCYKRATKKTLLHNLRVKIRHKIAIMRIILDNNFSMLKNILNEDIRPHLHRVWVKLIIKKYKWKYNQTKFVRFIHRINIFRRLIIFMSLHEIKQRRIEISRIKDPEIREKEENRLYWLYPEIFKKKMRKEYDKD